MLSRTNRRERVFGAMVRYRAYSTKGLTATQVAVLVVLCSYTFGFGNVLLGGVLLTYDPELMQRLSGFLPDIFTHPHTARAVGLACLGVVALYIIGSLMHFKPFNVGRFEILYPRPEVMKQQLFAAPLELIGAAGIIYFSLPEAGNPGYLVVLGAFLLSFSAALVSHAPGGLGVFELLFIKADARRRTRKGAGGLAGLASLLSDHSAAVRFGRGCGVRTRKAGGRAAESAIGGAAGRGREIDEGA